MELKKNHVKYFDLKEFDKIADNHYIDEKKGLLIKFYDNGFVQEKVNYYIEDIIEERAPLRKHSYNNLPSEVMYSVKGEVLKINYSVLGKLHSIDGRYLLSKENEISFWVNGVRKDLLIQQIFSYFNYKYNRENADLLLPFLKIFYKSPENIGEFLSLLKDLEITSPNCNPEKMDLLEMSYF